MAGQLNTTGHGIADALFAKAAIKDSFQAETLSGAVTLSDAYPSVTKFDPGGAHRDVTLDAVATNEGVWRWIVNAADAAENLVVKNAGGDTIGTVNQNESGVFYCNGSTWTLVAIVPIALS